MNKIILGLFTGLSLLISQHTTAGIYGVVIGIDEYSYSKPLYGAVNDAKVIADSLNAIGAKQIKLLVNDQASRDGIKKAWEDISSQAKSGDVVFFTYAGHGAQEPERVKGTETDGLDEFYLLGRFAESGKQTYERIIDDDLQEWFSKRPDLNIILISDSCHSGTMTRAYKSTKLNYRNATVKNITDDALPLPANAEIIDEQKSKLNHVIAFSATQDNESLPEVEIDNQAHGALSWYLAKGLRGEADDNADGTISAAELKKYLAENVRMKTEGQQHPQITYVQDIAIIKATKIQNKPASARLDNNLSPITFGVKNNSMPALDKVVTEKFKGINLVAPDKGILEWDADNAIIKNQFNDTVFTLPAETSKTKAYKRVDDNEHMPSPETLSNVQAVIDKFRIVEKLKAASDGSLIVKLFPDDKLHPKGENVSFELNNLKFPYLTLINLTADGKINFLYPSLQKDSLSIPLGKPYTLDGLEVTEPFGADHLIAILSDKPLLTLHEKLKQLETTTNPLNEFFTALTAALKDTKYQIGIHANFTTNSL